MRTLCTLAVLFAMTSAACGTGPAPTSTAPASSPSPAATAPGTPASGTQVVFLGTGTPLPDPDRSGPATAVVVNGSAYLIDAGAGVVRRAMQARRTGIAALDSVNLRTVFLTHLHSDHTMGLPDLVLTPWVMGRQAPLELYGPAGSRTMVDGIMAGWAEDIDHRLHDLQPATPNGYKVNVHEIAGGEVFKDDNVTVTAIPVEHGAWKAFAYRVQTADRTVVISGDARPSDALTQACDGCDLLIFEVYTMGSTAKVTPPWQAYRRAYHTSTEELAAIAKVSRPRRLVLYHRANPGCDQVGTNCGDSGSEAEALSEIRQRWDGEVIEAHDLDVF
ncbi:MAG: MBL fold metallo-hydrolase [Vicinamibacterales bacterium]